MKISESTINSPLANKLKECIKNIEGYPTFCKIDIEKEEIVYFENERTDKNILEFMCK